MSRPFRRILILLLVFVTAATVVGFASGNYFFNLALWAATDKSEVFSAPHNQIGNLGTVSGVATGEERKAAERWAEQVGRTATEIRSFDGLRLNAYEYTHEDAGGKWAVLAHGYTGNALQMLVSAKRFFEMGFNVLTPDARGHGESEGDYIGMGWHDRLDIVDWVDYLLAGQPDAQIVLFGVSMGAATVMMASGEALPDNVRAIVEDCGYSSVSGEFAYQMKQLFGIPAFPVMNFASAVTRLRAGFFLGEADAAAQVAKSKTPILFIHGDADTFVPFYMQDIVYEAAGAEKEKLVAPGAGHGMSAHVLGEEYWEAVASFLARFVD